MFKCDNCGRQTKAGEKRHTVNILREKEYEHYTVTFDRQTKRKKKEFYNTTGFESAGEDHYCSDCYGEQGEFLDGDNTQGKRHTDQVIKRRGSSIERRSKINRGDDRRVV